MSSPEVAQPYKGACISPFKTDYTRIEKTAYSFYVRRLADGGQEKGSRERTVMLPEGYHKRYTKEISGNGKT